jgi:hypothetical protein
MALILPHPETASVDATHRRRVASSGYRQLWREPPACGLRALLGFCVSDEKFICRHDDDQLYTHAYCVGWAAGEYRHLRAGPLDGWPKSSEWEEGFDLADAQGDECAEVHPLRRPQTRSTGRGVSQPVR